MLTGNEDSCLNLSLDDEPLTLETVRRESISYDPAEDREWESPEKLSKYLYKKGQVSSNCYFIVSGRVELIVGRDELKSDYGAFNVLGANSLKEPIYVPDFTAKVNGGSRILKLKRRDYMRLSRY
jgi:CRP-like cAMP-binding protein